jgi:hypothetical protein
MFVEKQAIQNLSEENILSLFPFYKLRTVHNVNTNDQILSQLFLTSHEFNPNWTNGGFAYSYFTDANYSDVQYHVSGVN